MFGRGLWQEFKAFAFKGNMIDLAVAVVIGAAFSGVVTSLVNDIVMPTVYTVIGAAQEAATKTESVAEKAASAVGVTTQPSTETSTQPSVKEPNNHAPPPPPAPSPDKPVSFTWKIGLLNIGSFVGAVLNFLIVAFIVFIIIVKLLGSVMKRVGSTPAPSEPTTRECPFCLSVIPIKAKKCAHCTADMP